MLLVFAQSYTQLRADCNESQSSTSDIFAAEHFIYAHSITHVFLSLLFNAFIRHEHLPTDFMKSAIVPIVKNKTGDTSDKNNYRPIALVTATSKLFEMCLLEILQMYLITHDHQFGFKTSKASNAFDRVNHWTLFTKLIYSGISLLIVCILVFWYQTQQLCIKWGGSTSRFFTISHGVRQGGILSPKIFALYMNGLTDELSNSYAACYIK